MLERLRLQEVEQIILTVPEGVDLAGTGLKYGEPVMIIDKPAASSLSFTTNAKNNLDAAYLSSSGLTKSLNLTINEGTVLYSVWSYLHGVNETKTESILRGSEWLTCNGSEYVELTTTTAPDEMVVYKETGEGLVMLIPGADKDYEVVINSQNHHYGLRLKEPVEGMRYFTTYKYKIEDVDVTTVKTIHNPAFATLDMYFTATDVNTDDKHTVCVHCDRVQVTMDLSLAINNSSKASFTPITIRSIPSEGKLNRDVATITVV